jgi:AraC-like DNA-binding protein
LQHKRAEQTIFIMKPGLNEKVYRVTKIATIVELLAMEGTKATDALAGVSLSLAQLQSPATRVSVNQILRSCENAIRLSRDPQFAYKAGLKFHVSTYSIYGFALLSSPNFRDTVSFAMKYHQLAAPLTEIQLKENGKTAVWTISPKPYAQVNDRLNRFVVELQMAIHLSLHREFMGSSFRPSELHFTFPKPRSRTTDDTIFECRALYGQPENQLVFDAHWLDGRPNLGNAVTYAELCQLCDRLTSELELSIGIAGRVRSMISTNLVKHAKFDSVARHLNMSSRSLRRKLQEEGTSFRELVDEVRAQVAIKYVRDTDLSIEDIASALGFNEASAFRHAFRRWTGSAPHEFRRTKPTAISTA